MVVANDKAGCPCCEGKGEKMEASKIHVMFAGNPNCGKSTIFNKLCNLRVRTGNYPGVTVERHVGNFNSDIQIIDIPGIYSLSSLSDEENIAVKEVLCNHVELIVNIIDANSLERSLYLTYELKMLGKPMVVLLNMWDSLKENNLEVDADRLSKELGLKVIPFSAVDGTGNKEFLEILNTKNFGAAVDGRYVSKEPKLAEALNKLATKVPAPFDNGATYWAKAAFVGDAYPNEVFSNNEFRDTLSETKDEIAKTFPNKVAYQILAEDRYSKIADIVNVCQKKQPRKTFSETLDKFLLNKYLSIPFFVVIMFLVYYISVTWLGAIVTDWTNDELFEGMIVPAAGEFLENVGAPEWLSRFLSEGVISGVGAVLGFVPQLVILFALLSFLEECGYMTRAAFILDKIFNFFGLSGRAFIPYLIGSGCGVPALMTARTLANESERRAVLFTNTMIPCGAKLPVIIVFASSIFSEYSWFAPSIYFISIFVIILALRILGKFSAFKSSQNPMLLELPAYHIPSAKIVALTVYQRAKMFVKKAGTIILTSVVVIWTLSTFTFHDEEKFITMTEDVEQSILADITKPLTPVLAPIGSHSFQSVTASIIGLIAKENLVSSLAVLEGLESEEDEGFGDKILANTFQGDKLAAFAFLFFNLFTLPCMAAVGTLKRELGDKKLFRNAVFFVLTFSYTLSVLVYQIPTMFMTHNIDAYGVAAIIILLGYIYLVFVKPSPKTEQRIEFRMETN